MVDFPWLCQITRGYIFYVYPIRIDHHIILFIHMYIFYIWYDMFIYTYECHESWHILIDIEWYWYTNRVCYGKVYIIRILILNDVYDKYVLIIICILIHESIVQNQYHESWWILILWCSIRLICKHSMS